MALPRLTALSVAVAACGGPAGGGAVAPTNAPKVSTAAEYTSGGPWGAFHSRRFQLTVPLPDGRAWKIDDHHAPELVATHDPTSSRLTILATREPDLMNRARCEERARQRGLVPTSATLATVEDDVHVGPDAYDARVWVALDPGKPDGRVEGHVFLFGAFLRQCLLVHLETAVPSSRDENVLASRLAVASARIVKALRIDPPRTTDDAMVPRDKPNVRR